LAIRLKRRVWLVVGIAVIVILAAISISNRAARRSREAILEVNLASMREVIKQYTKDKHRAPQSLQDLVAAGYFRELPIDPITNSNSTWNPMVEDVIVSPGETGRGITDIHSGSDSISSKGTIYNAW
jgi:general secretion pathway protein G